MPRGKEGRFVEYYPERPCCPLLSRGEMSHSHQHIYVDSFLCLMRDTPGM
jgi:hypothetical protein